MQSARGVVLYLYTKADKMLTPRRVCLLEPLFDRGAWLNYKGHPKGQPVCLPWGGETPPGVAMVIMGCPSNLHLHP